MSPELTAVETDVDLLLERLLAIRQFSEELAQQLSAEDCALQSMPDASPTKWHLAHTTWFFETFALCAQPDYHIFDKSFGYLLNSYYNTIGRQFPRAQRGMISRPELDDVLAYRRHVDGHLATLLTSKGNVDPQLARIVEIGLHHEQQHQELILTDIKHAFSLNPLQPTYREGLFSESQNPASQDWLEFKEGIHWIGHAENEFCFDNELPSHREFLDSFQLGSRLVTCGEYLQFVEEGGYERPEFWLSLGWDQVRQLGWKAPLYWDNTGGQWQEFTLAGPHKIDPALPVCHVSYFEADAFARWAGARLPTESEWEVASRDTPIEGKFVDSDWDDGTAIHPGCGRPPLTRPSGLFGDVWEWTASPYIAYPGYAPPAGALGEYNGKFMCNQYVLRGGSCATSSTHFRKTYRNFFPPEARWQFTGIRLCR